MARIALVFLIAAATAPTSPNLVTNGAFEKIEGTRPVGWDAFFIVHDAKGKEYRPKLGETFLGSCVRWEKESGVEGTGAICIEMDRHTAENYGQGYFSQRIPVEPGTEYEVSADIKSDAPNAILFVKGYGQVEGKWREVYTKHKEAHFDRYLKKGPYSTLTFRFHPRHGAYRIEHVRVWLYAYLKPGRVWFDNVKVTKVGPAKPGPTPSGSKPRPVPPRPADPHPPIYRKR